MLFNQMLESECGKQWKILIIWQVNHQVAMFGHICELNYGNLIRIVYSIWSWLAYLLSYTLSLNTCTSFIQSKWTQNTLEVDSEALLSDTLPILPPRWIIKMKIWLSDTHQKNHKNLFCAAAGQRHTESLSGWYAQSSSTHFSVL